MSLAYGFTAPSSPSSGGSGQTSDFSGLQTSLASKLDRDFGNPTLNTDGKIDFGGEILGNIANATAGTDAVSRGQMETNIQSAATQIAAQLTTQINPTLDAKLDRDFGNLRDEGGLDFQGQQLQNIAPGTSALHAVNKQQMEQLVKRTSDDGGLDVQNKKVVNVEPGTAEKDAVNKGQLDEKLDSNITQELDVRNNKIVNLANGTDAEDAINRSQLPATIRTYMLVFGGSIGTTGASYSLGFAYTKAGPSAIYIHNLTEKTELELVAHHIDGDEKSDRDGKTMYAVMSLKAASGNEEAVMEYTLGSGFLVSAVHGHVHPVKLKRKIRDIFTTVPAGQPVALFIGIRRAADVPWGGNESGLEVDIIEP